MRVPNPDASHASIDTAILDRVQRGDVPKLAAILESMRAAPGGASARSVCTITASRR